MQIRPIEIKVMLYALKELAAACDNVGTVFLLSKETRAIASFSLNLYIKLQKKVISRLGKDEKKPIKLSFEYYEAYLLEKYLMRYNAHNNIHTIQTIINDLNQKLA